MSYISNIANPNTIDYSVDLSKEYKNAFTQPSAHVWEDYKLFSIFKEKSLLNSSYAIDPLEKKA